MTVHILNEVIDILYFCFSVVYSLYFINCTLYSNLYFLFLARSIWPYLLMGLAAL